MPLIQKKATQTSGTSDLVSIAQQQELAERIRTTEAHCAAVRAELAEARIMAEPAHRLWVLAEEAWDAAGDVHSVADAQRLEQRRAADEQATARVADLERQLTEAEGALAMLTQDDARYRGFARAEELWPPVCQALVEPVRALIPALKAQRAAWKQLVEERATGSIERETELALYGVGFGDELLPELERWLAVAEHNGFAKPAKK